MKILWVRPIISSVLYLAIFFVSVRCETDGEVPAPLAVVSISPSTGKKNTAVEILGTGFDTNGSNNSVTFNGKSATVISATNTKLTVQVPPGAGTGAVIVSTRGQTFTGPDFSYLLTFTVSDFAGSSYGYADGTGASAKFKGPMGMAVDAQDNLYVADRDGNRIRKVTLTGTVSTIAGTGVAGLFNGNAMNAQFSSPSDVALDESGNIYVADYTYNSIRKISTSGLVTTLAGSAFNGWKDGNGTAADFNNPVSIEFSSSKGLYVLDQQNNAIRRVTLDGNVTTFSGRPHDYTPAFMDGNATTARFNQPSSIALDGAGNIYVADRINMRIRKVDTDGNVVTLSGDGNFGFVNGAITSAQFYFPAGVAVNVNGTIYIADERNHAIRMIENGVVTTIAGTGVAGDVSGPGESAQFNHPACVLVNKAGHLIISDRLNNKIKKIEID